MKVSVEYEDGSTCERSPTEWSVMRADGVQKVTVSCCGRSAQFHSASIYWLYKEDDHYVVGCGSVRYDPNPLHEVLIFPSGHQKGRYVEFMPDLPHAAIKLGWWKHG